MRQIRKGIDVKIKWRVRLSNPNEKLDNLTFILTDSKLNHIKLADVNVTDTDVVTGTFYGKDLRTLGEYNATLWKNWGMKGQTCVDRIRAFELVPFTPCADNTVELQDNTLWVGIQGESAYQSWLNTGHTGTEEDFIEYLRAKVIIDEENKEAIENIISDYTSDKFNEINEKIDNFENYDDTEIRDLINQVDYKIDNIDLSDYYTKGEVRDGYVSKNELKGVEEVFDENLQKINSSIYNVSTKINDLSTYIDNLEIPEVYDDTEIKSRLDNLENKEDKDTVYNDEEVRQLISDLDTKVDNIVIPEIPDVDLSDYYTKEEVDNKFDNLTDNDTIYDDTSIVNRINDLSNNIDSLVIPSEYDDTEIKSRLDNLEAKEDADTIYDDTEVKTNISALQTKINDLSTYIDNLEIPEAYNDSSIVNKVNDLSTYIDNLEIQEVDLTDYYTKEEVDIKLDNLTDNDTIYDDTEIKSRLDEIESINFNEFIKGRYITLDNYASLTEYEDILYFIVEN